jgi:glycosyltransferase involved in cell wall biosynthesis
MTSTHMKLSIVIPVYNERSTIREVIEKVKAIEIPLDKEIIIADDGSTDGTDEIIQSANIDGTCVVHTSLINLGKGAALRFGLEYCNGDIVIIQDADLELSPDEYPALIAPIISGQADIVYGSRLMTPETRGPFLTVLANRVLSLYTSLLFGTWIYDMETAYKVFRTDIIRSLNLKSTGFEIEPELTAKALRLGYRILEIPIKYHPRTRAEGKKVKWLDGLMALYYLTKYRFSDKAGLKRSWPLKKRKPGAVGG